MSTANSNYRFACLRSRSRRLWLTYVYARISTFERRDLQRVRGNLAVRNGNRRRVPLLPVVRRRERGPRYASCCFRCSYVKKLMVMAVFLVGVGRLEEVPDAAGEVALEAADGFAGGLAFGAFAGDVVLGFGVAARAGDGDAVDARR